MSSRHSDQIITGNPWDGYTFPAKLFGEGPSFWDILSISSCFFSLFSGPPRIIRKIQKWWKAQTLSHCQSRTRPGSPLAKEITSKAGYQHVLGKSNKGIFFFWISLMCCISTHINLYQSISTHINPLPGLEDGGGEWRLSPWNSADGFPGRSYFGKPRGAHSHQLLGRNKEGVQPGVIASTSIWNGSGRPLNWQLLFEKIVEYLLSYI